MKAVLATVLCMCVLGANLKEQQMTGMSMSNFPGMDVINQLNQQFLDILTNMTASFLLQQLYPDNWQSVLGEVDACVDSAMAASMNDTQSVMTDAFNLMNACSSPDPSQAVNQLIQDTLNSLTALLSPQCTFSVDLMGDLSTFVATAISQGMSMMGPFSQFMMMGMGPMMNMMNQMNSQMMAYYQPMINSMNTMMQNMAVSMGVSRDDLNKFNSDVNTTMTDLTAAGTDFQTSGNVTEADVNAVLNDFNTLMADEMAELNDVVANMQTFISQGVNQMCALFGSFGSMMPNFNSFMMTPQA